MFNNAGAPITGDIDLQTLTGVAVRVRRGPERERGFHGNGKDAYVAVNSGQHEGQRVVWVTVLTMTDPALVEIGGHGLDPHGPARRGGCRDREERRGDCGVQRRRRGQSGAVCQAVRIRCRRRAIGSTFFVSELEDTASVPGARLAGCSPRIALRDGLVAIAWGSDNDSYTLRRLAPRWPCACSPCTNPATLESVVYPPGPRPPIIVPATDSRNNWEPYASVLGTSTFLIEGNTYAEGRHRVPTLRGRAPTGRRGTHETGRRFLRDNGQPFRARINYSRQDGNPGRVAGDKRRSGQLHGGWRSLAHLIDAFNRTTAGTSASTASRTVAMARCKTFAIDPTTLTQTMLSKAQDSGAGPIDDGHGSG